MIDIRRILIIFVIGVLYTVLVFSTINAVYPNPEYSDFCGENIRAPKLYRAEQYRTEQDCPDHNIPQAELDACTAGKGQPEYKYDPYGCVTSWECSHCMQSYNDSRERHNFVSFIISAILGLIGVAVGLYMPVKKGGVNEWIGSGFMLGGMISIFIGTMMYFGDLHRILRPFVILLELILVIWLAYKKLGK